MKADQLIAGRYRLTSRLGVGGMGEVWGAIHTGTGRDFAIKFMHAHAAASENARQRFSREARASAKINHPNIIDVFDVGEMDDGVLYLVMELLDGVALGDAFHAQPPLSVQDLLAILVDTAQALSAAHGVGIIHRDIKPANVFLHRDRSTGLAFAKILDFGISKFTGDDNATKTGSILGSPRYMSPEQTRSAAAADARADIWAMGVMTFEGLTGTWPHEGDSFSALVVNICTVPPASIDQRAPHLPEVVRAIVRSCLCPFDERIQSAAELSARFEAALEDESLANIPLPRPLHTPGEGFKSTTGLRVRPHAISSLSASRNQARASISQPGNAQANLPPLGAPPAPANVPPPRPPPSRGVAPPAPTPPPRTPPSAPQTRPLSAIGEDTTTNDGRSQVEAATLAIEPATMAFEPATIAHDPPTNEVLTEPRGSGLARARPPMTAPMPAIGPPTSGRYGPSMPIPAPAPPASRPFAHAPPPASSPFPGAVAQAQQPGDPLVQSVSAMHLETPAGTRTPFGPPELARTPDPAPSAIPASTSGPTHSNKKLGILAAVLAAAFLGIVVALVATIRGGASSTPVAAAAEPAAATATAAAPPEVTPAPPVPEAVKTAEPITSATSPTTTPSAAPSASASASAKPDALKGEKSAKTKPPRSPSPPATTPGKPPKRVQDLGSGL